MAPESEEFEQKSVQLESGDRLFIYSDGLTDTMNADGEIFGATRLLESASRHESQPLDDMLGSLMDDVAKWRGEIDTIDDVSILALEVS